MHTPRAVAHQPTIVRMAWVGAMIALLVTALVRPAAAADAIGVGAAEADGDPPAGTAAAETEDADGGDAKDDTEKDDGSAQPAPADDRGDERKKGDDDGGHGGEPDDRGDRGDHGKDRDDEHVGERTVVWTGHGGEHASVACPDGTGTWHFVLTPSGGITITDATLTVRFGTDTIVVGGERSGAQDQGAWHFHVERAGGGTVTAASASVTHEGVPAGMAAPLLTISDSWCVPGEVDDAAGDLVVVKDSRGWSPNDPDFEFALSCVLDGTTIIDTTFAITDDESWSYAAIHGPIGAAWDGATCTLTETEDHGAASVRMRDGGTWLDVVDNTATFTLRTGGTDTQTITVRNERGEVLPREEGNVVVVKEAAGWDDDPAFGFSLVCVLDGTVVISETFTLTAGASWSYADVHAGIGAAWDGATCTLTETEDHGATAIRMRDGDTELVVVDNASTFALVTGGTATQTITVHDERADVLPRREGDLVVVKEAAGWDDDPAFGFSLVCVLDGATVISETFTLTAGDSWSYAALRGGIGAAWDGAACTLTETATHEATTIGMQDGTTPLTVTDGAATFLLQTGGEQRQTVTVSNERVPVVPPTPPTPPTPPVTPPTPPVTPPTPPVPTQVLPQVLERAERLPVTGLDALALSLLAAGLVAAGAAALRSTRRPRPDGPAGSGPGGGTRHA
jgi:hypothetical protein